MTRILGLIFLAAFGSSIAEAAQTPTGEQQIMIIVTAGPANSATAVAITRLSFLSAEACAAAAKII